ncbi:hypothetical protein CRUP_021018 [Coryphaenoides rupestris]|nr:hypothetical protein CRUP_021018 [Coryphaenoides rupestris]
MIEAPILSSHISSSPPARNKMPAVHHKLLLEDALQDSPQTRSLLSVFEEDAGTLTDYTNQLLQSMQRVFGAQSEMGLATQQLSKQLLDYEKKNFALGKGDEEVITTLQHFAKTVEELNALHTDLANQMADNMVFPLIQFREKDLTGRYLASPRMVKADLVKEVAYTRRKQHQASMQYYCALNALQYRKRVAMLEPMLGYTQAQVKFFKTGMDLVSKKMDNFLSSVNSMAQKELLSVEDTVYMPDKDPDPVSRSLIQKSGYLNIRKEGT